MHQRFRHHKGTRAGFATRNLPEPETRVIWGRVRVFEVPETYPRPTSESVEYPKLTRYIPHNSGTGKPENPAKKGQIWPHLRKNPTRYPRFLAKVWVFFVPNTYPNTKWGVKKYLILTRHPKKNGAHTQNLPDSSK